MDRREALEKYERAKREGKVDDDIISLLNEINSSLHYYTTSSCSGRIILIQLPEIGDKINSEIIGKWHRKVEFSEILERLKNYKEGYLFLLVQSSIIHVVCENLEYANKLLEIARNCGFKYSSIKSIKKGRFLVEILSSENLHIPLGEEGKIRVNKEDLEFFIRTSNIILERIKRKLKTFETEIKFLLSSS